jgi:hypothetical protein
MPRESPESLKAYMRRTRTAAGSTCCPVKHPYGNFQKPVRAAAGEIAPKHCIAGLVDHRMDIDRSAEPGMPWIKNLAPVGNVGVLAFSCTTENAHTPLLAANPQPWSIG